MPNQVHNLNMPNQAARGMRGWVGAFFISFIAFMAFIGCIFFIAFMAFIGCIVFIAFMAFMAGIVSIQTQQQQQHQQKQRQCLRQYWYSRPMDLISMVPIRGFSLIFEGRRCYLLFLSSWILEVHGATRWFSLILLDQMAAVLPCDFRWFSLVFEWHRFYPISLFYWMFVDFLWFSKGSGATQFGGFFSRTTDD